MPKSLEPSLQLFKEPCHNFLTTSRFLLILELCFLPPKIFKLYLGMIALQDCTFFITISIVCIRIKSCHGNAERAKAIENLDREPQNQLCTGSKGRIRWCESLTQWLSIWQLCSVQKSLILAYFLCSLMLLYSLQQNPWSLQWLSCLSCKLWFCFGNTSRQPLATIFTRNPNTCSEHCTLIRSTTKKISWQYAFGPPKTLWFQIWVVSTWSSVERAKLQVGVGLVWFI